MDTNPFNGPVRSRIHVQQSACGYCRADCGVSVWKTAGGSGGCGPRGEPGCGGIGVRYISKAIAVRSAPLGDATT